MSNLLKTHETIKLHYGKYLYKLRINNQLASIFRTEHQRKSTLSFAKQQLQEYNNATQDGLIIKKGRWNNVIISNSDLVDANHIYACLRYYKKYMVRCEYNTLMIYTNNLNFLMKIANNMQSSDTEIWQPNQESLSFLKNNKNIILVDNIPDLKFKVTFGRQIGNPQLATWLRSNTDKSRAGKIFLKNCLTSGWINGQYIFVRDEKVLLFINMIAGDNIVKVEELVYRHDIKS
jgi:hypothetical protein|tara:strand:+ start:1606 stop:2304 length:699 start_codon:yes stop_codon:yes gene_type:complete